MAATRVRPILVCEDDPSLASLFGDILEAAGYRAVGTPSGEAALRLAQTLRPAVILLDLSLPDLDGATVLTRLKGNPTTADIPVVIVSAYPGWLTFLDRGLAVAVVEKPCTPAELEAVIEEALDGRRRRNAT